MDDGGDVTSGGWHGQLNSKGGRIVRYLVCCRSKVVYKRIYPFKVLADQIDGLFWGPILGGSPGACICVVDKPVGGLPLGAENVPYLMIHAALNGDVCGTLKSHEATGGLKSRKGKAFV